MFYGLVQNDKTKERIEPVGFAKPHSADVCIVCNAHTKDVSVVHPVSFQPAIVWFMNRSRTPHCMCECV